MEHFNLVVQILNGVLIFIGVYKAAEVGFSKKIDKLINQPYNELETKLKETTDSNTINRNGLIALLYNEIYQRCEKAQRDGEISMEDKKNLDIMFEAYSDLGGNHSCEDLYEQISELTIKL